MQSKVTQTRMYSYPSTKSYQVGVPISARVTEGKLVLIECKPDPDTSILFRSEGYSRLMFLNRGLAKGLGQCFKPIIISETEKIDAEVDWIYHSVTKQFRKSQIDDLMYSDQNWNKVLVLPNQFSPKHLQAIVDDKIKDRDKVLVECVDFNKADTDFGFNGSDWIKIIGLNSQGHVVLHKIEEKMYTRAEVIKIAISYREQFINIMDDSKWFEQNVK